MKRKNRLDSATTFRLNWLAARIELFREKENSGVVLAHFILSMLMHNVDPGFVPVGAFLVEKISVVI